MRLNSWREKSDQQKDFQELLLRLNRLALEFLSFKCLPNSFRYLSINDSVYSCVFFFLTGLHFFHLLLGLLLLSLLFWGTIQESLTCRTSMWSRRFCTLWTLKTASTYSAKVWTPSSEETLERHELLQRCDLNSWHQLGS